MNTTRELWKMLRNRYRWMPREEWEALAATEYQRIITDLQAAL